MRIKGKPKNEPHKEKYSLRRNNESSESRLET
jgi:hypothetical protein